MNRAWRWLERLLVLGAAAYVVVFAWRQTPGLGDRRILEWDTLQVVLPAWRFHGTNLFPRDLTVDFLQIYATPAWTAIYWLGTLFTDPLMLAKCVPFVGLAVVVWQGWAFGKRFGGAALGAATVILLVHCTSVWNRMAGGHARGFGYPLVIAFIRYAAIGAERRTLAVLLLEALSYPSVFVFCGPAWGLVTILQRQRPMIVRAVIVGVVGVVIASRIGGGFDPRIGHPVSPAEAATLLQMQAGGPTPYYPLPVATRSIATTATLAWKPDGETWKGVAQGGGVALALLGLGLVLLGRRLRELPVIFLLLPLTAFAAFGLAYAVAYRLYLPDRMLSFGWPPVALLLAPLVALHALRPRLGERAPIAAATLLIVVTLGLAGDGLVIAENLTPFNRHDTATIAFLADTPKDTIVVTHPDRASFVQAFARRGVPFSASTNHPFFDAYAREMQRRIEVFYRAYYATDPGALRRLRDDLGADLLVVDERDFGPDAIRRADYYEPWRSLNRALLAGVDPQTMALAHPPAAAIVFRDGPRQVVDLRRLP